MARKSLCGVSAKRLVQLHHICDQLEDWTVCMVYCGEVKGLTAERDGDETAYDFLLSLFVEDSTAGSPRYVWDNGAQNGIRRAFLRDEKGQKRSAKDGEREIARRKTVSTILAEAGAFQ